MVGDEFDFHVWRQRRKAWAENAITQLSAIAGPELAAELRATAFSPRRLDVWPDALSAEVAAVARVAQMLLEDTAPQNANGPANGAKSSTATGIRSQPAR